MPLQAKPFHSKTLNPTPHDRNLIAARLNLVALCAVFAFIGAVIFGLI